VDKPSAGLRRYSVRAAGIVRLVYRLDGSKMAFPLWSVFIGSLAILQGSSEIIILSPKELFLSPKDFSPYGFT
jgi:hypothetical protein